MRLSQEELQELDSEIVPLRNKEGIFTLQKQFSWMFSKGAILLDGFGRPIIKQVFEGGKLLYEVLDDKLAQYRTWVHNGRKINNIGNFRINESKTRQKDTKVETVALDVQRDFDADIAAAFN